MSQEEEKTQEADKDIRQRMSTIFPDPSTAQRVADLIATDKPANWGRKSNAPYYKGFYAEWLKVHIDKMMASTNDLVFRYAVFCGDNEAEMTHETLYNQVYQSKRYLLERLDPLGKYKQWDKLVDTKKEKGLGVTIRYNKLYRMQLDGKDLPSPDEVNPQAHIPKWKKSMEEWLESGETTPFVEEKLALNEEEILELRKQLGELEGIHASINSYAVRIIRTN